MRQKKKSLSQFLLMRQKKIFQVILNSTSFQESLPEETKSPHAATTSPHPRTPKKDRRGATRPEEQEKKSPCSSPATRRGRGSSRAGKDRASPTTSAATGCPTAPTMLMRRFVSAVSRVRDLGNLCISVCCVMMWLALRSEYRFMYLRFMCTDL